MRPKYPHHCKKCRYRGSFHMDGKIYDAYFCPKCDGADGTVLLRDGAEDSEYASYPTFLLNQGRQIYMHVLRKGDENTFTFSGLQEIARAVLTMPDIETAEASQKDEK